MDTRVLVAPDSAAPAEASAAGDAIREAARALARGDLVVFPTETVYGLGSSAVHPGAVEALHALKERPGEKPFSLHLPDPGHAARYAGALNPVAQRLIRKAWPGPLTLVVPDRRPPGSGPAGLIERGIYVNGTVGLRCPSHRVGRAILREAGVPIVASSANLAGRPPPRTAAEALADLAGKVALVVDAGPAPYARPSTVVRIGQDGSFEVLREGAVTAHRVARLARTRILFVCTGNVCRSPMAEGLARQVLANRLGCDTALVEDQGIDLESAGTAASGGLPPSRHAVEAMEARGINIRGHVSRPLTVDALLAADYICVMGRAHLEEVRRLAPEAAGRAALLDAGGRDIEDPMGGERATYDACARAIEQGLRARLEEVW